MGIGKKLIAKNSSADVRNNLLTENSPFAMREAYSAIRTKLLFTGKGEKCPVFAVTSATMHNGKTTNAVNLAVSIASTAKKVLLIDGDMRKPTVHRYFGIENKNGLSEILAGLTNEVKIRKTSVENMHVLTSGHIPPNPAELFSSRQMDNLLDYVRNYFDYVIIDTPPINVVTDATVLAERITGYIFIVQSGTNHFAEVNYALENLQQMNGNVVGFILNDMVGKSRGHYGNYGYYRYSYKRKSYGYEQQQQNAMKKQRADAIQAPIKGVWESKEGDSQG